MLKRLFLVSIFTLFSSFFVSADTTDQTWMTKVELKKTGMHCADDKNCFNRYHPNIPPAAKANPGDMIILHSPYIRLNTTPNNNSSKSSLKSSLQEWSF